MPDATPSGIFPTWVGLIKLSTDGEKCGVTVNASRYPGYIELRVVDEDEGDRQWAVVYGADEEVVSWRVDRDAAAFALISAHYEAQRVTINQRTATSDEADIDAEEGEDDDSDDQ